MLLKPVVPRALAKAAVAQLAQIDYDVATRVSHDVSTVASWAYDHDAPWLATFAVDALRFFDDFGSVLIALVAWIVHHTA